MSLAHLPAMLVSETEGWSDILHRHPTARHLMLYLVMPMSLIPPVMYAYSELVNPGAVFPLSVPAMSGNQLLMTGIVFYAAQLAMVGFMAMLIQRMSLAEDHDPGYENAYTLAAIAPVPLWLAPLALLVPSLGFNMLIGLLAWAASIALIRHGVRPMLKVDDTRKAHYIANVVTFAGIAAWIGLMVISALILSMLLGWWGHAI